MLLQRDNVQCERRRVDRAALAPVEPAVRIAAANPVASIVVIDDHAMLVEPLVEALRHDGFVTDAITPCPPGTIVEHLAPLQPTLALIDLDLGEIGYSGFDLIGPIVDCNVDVVALSSSHDRLLVAASFDAGAKAVLSKAAPFATMLDAVRLAARGELVPDPRDHHELRGLLRKHRAAHSAQLERFHQLSQREQEVLARLLDGHSAERIAQESFVSITTVRTQIRAVLSKLQVSSQLEAVAAVRRYGWAFGEAVPMVRYSSTLTL